ncbi:hypothetical protein ACIBSW_18735 [Actinoplanes sp. NPDC049668]|uniref:hypothetical protein n=1 Tax=unclassified Actinoplanes TaxID=2626549 RepID=UPI0033AFE68D
MSGSVRSVGVLEIQPELGGAEIVSAWGEVPALTERVEFEGGADGSLGSLVATLGDEPARNAWHRWFRSEHDGVDVGLSLFPFDVEDDWCPEPARPGPAAPKARRTGKLRSRRMRIALAGIASIAVLNLGASLSDRAAPPGGTPVPGGAAPGGPGTPQSQAHIDGLRFFPLPAQSASVGARANGAGPVARR